MRKKIGTALILLSVFILTYIYYPIFSVYFGVSQTPINPSGNYIIIPKIRAQAQIIDNVDPWNEPEYQKALKQGVAKAKGYQNFYFAHSSLPPWEMTRTNIPFLRLGELSVGDQIIIYNNGSGKTYSVDGKQEVWPWQVSAISGHENEIILQTCIPVGTDFRRLLVFAKASS